MIVCRMTQAWRKTESGEVAEVYGIVVKEEGRLLLEEADLSGDREMVLSLVADINVLQPEPIHFADILEDFVNRE